MANEREQQLLPAYLVRGSDELKRAAVVKRLQQRLEKEGDLAFNYEHFNGESAEGDSIVAACNTLPFASPLRLVQVDSCEKLKKADSEALVAYLEQPCETTVLCLVAASLSDSTRLAKAVRKLGANSIIECAPIAKRDLPQHVRAMAASHGMALTASAASLLVDLVGENTVALDAELRKLSLAHRGTDPINDGEVSSMVARTNEAKPWEFVDAFSSRNLAKCMILRSRMASTSPVALLAMCTTRVRELIMAKSLEARGSGAQLADMLHVPAWRVKNHAAWARAFTEEELRSALMASRDAERAMKSGSDPEEALVMWVSGVVSRG